MYNIKQPSQFSSLREYFLPAIHRFFLSKNTKPGLNLAQNLHPKDDFKNHGWTFG
jgi:hypothetical protein